MPHHRRVVFVAAARAKQEMKSLHRRAGVEVVQDPSDAVLADLFAATRVVVHPSLSNGGGIIPMEALALDCAVVASRTGWLWAVGSTGPLCVVDRHDAATYSSRTASLLDHTAAPSPARAAGT